MQKLTQALWALILTCTTAQADLPLDPAALLARLQSVDAAFFAEYYTSGTMRVTSLQAGVGQTPCRFQHMTAGFQTQRMLRRAQAVPVIDSKELWKLQCTQPESSERIAVELLQVLESTPQRRTIVRVRDFLPESSAGISLAHTFGSQGASVTIEPAVYSQELLTLQLATGRGFGNLLTIDNVE
jgi:hypothetical protein